MPTASLPDSPTPRTVPAPSAAPSRSARHDAALRAAARGL
ncbi:DNA primase, partial [Streptomyces albidoflavus]